MPLFIERFVKIHKESYPDCAISKYFTWGFLTKFYYELHAKGEVFFELDNDIRTIGFACIVYNLEEFERQFKRKYWIRSILELLIVWFRGYADYKQILTYVKTKKYYDEYGPHLGSIALAKEYIGTKEGRNTIESLISQVYKHLEYRGDVYLSCSVHAENIRMQKFLIRHDFKLIEESNSIMNYLKEL